MLKLDNYYATIMMIIMLVMILRMTKTGSKEEENKNDSNWYNVTENL